MKKIVYGIEREASIAWTNCKEMKVAWTYLTYKFDTSSPDKDRHMQQTKECLVIS